jgi:hypothetical protein
MQMPFSLLVSFSFFAASFYERALLTSDLGFARQAYVPNTGTAGSAPVIDRRHLDPIPLKHNVGRQSDSAANTR